jgi:hypothetical protein
MFELSWLLEGRILYAMIENTITEVDDTAFDNAVQQFLDRNTGLPVHIITDYTELETIQTEITPLHGETQDHLLSKHPALGIRVCVSSDHNALLRYLTPLKSFALKLCAHTEPTVESALEYLYTIDPTLPTEHVALRKPA